MKVELIKRMMDACYLAKRARDMLPPLPEGVMPSYIQYLDALQKLEAQGVLVRVSDLSEALGLPRPGVTRTVKEMEAKGYLHKQVHRSGKAALPEIRCRLFSGACPLDGPHFRRRCRMHDRHHRNVLSDHGRKENFV